MIVYPQTYADRGCWISDNRVYAFVSSALNGIAEIGYHGAQPASRNVRVFVGRTGVLRFALATEAGRRQQLILNDFDWSPNSMRMAGSSPIGNARLEINASGKNIQIDVTDVSREAAAVLVQLDKSSLFTDVHGRRTWRMFSVRTGWADFLLRDEIVLNEWMKRESPYGCDFLIPEPLRRRIFKGRVRAGLATPEDILPEFQNSSLPIYTAEVRVEMGGEGYSVFDEGESTLFAAPVDGGIRSVPPFVVRFDATQDVREKKSAGAQETVSVRSSPRGMPAAVPAIKLPGFGQIEQFFSTVPGLVESCMISEHGIPRATPGGYYWIWAWDALVTALTSLRWGGTEIAEGTAAFVEAHRDEGCIPMRWTHSLEALDTQPRGALEALLASLVYAAARERRGASVSVQSYGRMVEHLKGITERSDRRGLFSNIGFYPDLPLRFGRTEESTASMEVAAFYSFLRVCTNCARANGDLETVRAAEKVSSTLEQTFGEIFWDNRRRFFIDAVDRKSGLRNMSYPLFSLLFLHHSPGLQLIRSYIAPSADFIARNLLTQIGMRLLPAWDKNVGSETVSDSWYPHWDIYALRLLRKAGRPTEVMTWLRGVELVLDRLGYAPEYLVLNPSLASDPSAWLQHGAASNLNCATGWYQALLEGVMGMEFDPGGLTIMPLALPLQETAVDGVFHLGTQWNVKAKGSGGRLQEVYVDGRVQEGCLKIPLPHHDGGWHEIELFYGEGAPVPHFIELANAEVLDVSSSASGVEVNFNALGQVDLVLSAPDEWSLYLNGKHVRATKQEYAGPRVASLPIVGKHTALLSRRG